MPELPRYLDTTAVAARLGIAVGSVHDYRRTGRLPETIERYVARLAPWAHVHRASGEAS